MYWNVVERPWPPIGLFMLGTIVLFTALCCCLRPCIPFVEKRWFICTATGCALIGALVIGSVALQSFPNSGDEYAYLFQTWTYRAGRLWNPPPPLGQLMASNYTWVTADRWAGQYGPGWPLLMLPAILVGLPGWVANVPLTGIAAWLLFGMVERRAGRAAAGLASLAFVFSPFTMFNTASFFPHVLSATLVLMAYGAHDREIARPRPQWPIVVGVAIGILAATRNVTAAVAAAPILFDFACRRDLRWRRLTLLGAAIIPFVVGVLWYQWKLTGHPLKPGYYLGGRTVDHLYFDTSSIELGIVFMIGRFLEMTLWASPLLVPIWALCLMRKSTRLSIEAADLVFPAGLLLFVFYPFAGGNRYGPRYLFDFWPMSLFTIATAIPLISGKSKRFTEYFFGMSIIYGLSTTPFLAADFHRIVNQRRYIFDITSNPQERQTVACLQGNAGILSPLTSVDLPRNGIEATAHTLYVRCVGDALARIRKTYPDRRILLYRYGSAASRGAMLTGKGG